ncbi:GNAT family N-acetyltransferase [Nonomuraea sp. NPDC046570]|uniref:GNAT family N-acetyltransferase n=1 Tax=Nonomuraea sp. NPDC046570 TaxID=3155255 RepID=UPI0033E3B66B
MKLDILHPDTDPEPAGWEDFRQTEHLPAFWAYDVIAAASAGSRARPLLTVFRDEGRIVGAVGAIYFGLRLPGSTRAARPRREPLVLDVWLPGHSNKATWHFSREVTPEARRTMLREFERAAARHLGWGLAGVLYRMLTEPELTLVTRRGSISRDSLGTSVMDIQWSSVDGWLGSLSKTRRKSLRRQIRAVTQATDLRVEEGTARHDLDPAEMSELNRLHTTRLAPRRDLTKLLPAEYFAAVARRDDVTVISYHDEGRLLAFNTLFHHPTAPISATWATLPVAAGGRKDLYFDLYARLVRRMADEGAKQLYCGRGRVELKRSLGFDYVPMKVLVVPRWAMG